MNWMVDFLKYRWRALLAAVLGVVVFLVMARSGFKPGAAGLVGWNVCAAAFLIPTLAMLLLDDEVTVRARARKEDENRAVLMSIILCAVAAALGAIIIALRESKGGHGSAPPWLAALSISTLVLSWLVVQCLFTLHYTHRYFGDRDDDGADDRGMKFPGDAPKTYKDFIYVAVCIGATCQVSDFNITSSKFRNLVTTHAIIAFFFNTMILALGINIIGNVMGQ